MIKQFALKLSLYFTLSAAALVFAGPVWATPIGSLDGNRIILIDGNGDGGSNITLLSTSSSSLTFGYYLNGSTTFTPFGLLTTFSDRDILDLALTDGLTTYRASGDLSDPLYSLEMDYAGEVGAPFSSQEPLPSWLDTYYSSLTVTWHLPTEVSTSINFAMTPGDGLAPVPEPASLILMGSGLAGLGFWSWRRSKKA